ncbi:tubulin-specific chaperone A-like [Paramacrobiotus metropolitanus]|uniref:tubulin-specific chaperone A-like n=1 Tax=Paramacrobiotus metropolitanus TaxID=2943436 RepID=UPI00244596AD|nr:tubulin-specific chaperone A-like [Paramacrobiotus metropolitanus]
MSDPRLRNLKVKTGVVKRLFKEKISYEKEMEKERQKLNGMKQKGEDEYRVKKQEEVVQECLMMIPNCKIRLSNAWTDLKTTLDSEPGFSNTEEYREAKKVLDEVEPNLR